MSEIAVNNRLDNQSLGGSVRNVTNRDGLAGLRGRENVSPSGADFRSSLREALNSVSNSVASTNQAEAREALKFSAHAVDRMKSRGISFAPDMMKNIENAVSRAASKGSRDTLVLAGDNALIVSVKNNTVVTVMDRAAMRDNVFTNIDSTVVV